MHDEFSQNTGPTCDGMTTRELSRQREIGMSMSFAAGSLALTSPTLATARGLKASEAVYGESSHGSFAFYDLESSSWKTWQRCLLSGLVTFSGNWPAWGSMRNGVVFRRVPWVRHTCGTACSSLPTLTVVSCEHPGRQKLKAGQQTCISMELAKRDGWRPGGQYNPSHAAWFMGFPESWTDLGG